MEIERKFLVARLPDGLETFPKRHIEQAYLCWEPVVRVRRSDAHYTLTCKGAGLLAREEHEIPLSEPAYRHLRAKADGAAIAKDRYAIPLEPYTAELDLFLPPFAPLALVEVEFPSRQAAEAFRPPRWFGREVTWEPAYQNVSLSRAGTLAGLALS